MVVYKVFYKNYELKKGELIGTLIERRKDLRGTKELESGLRWAMLAFGPMVEDKKAIFVVPSELKLGSDSKWFMEKAILTKGEFYAMVKLVGQEMKRE
jgi:hypothetical protein